MLQHNHPGVYEVVKAVHEARIDSARASMAATRSPRPSRLDQLRSDRSPLRFAANLFAPMRHGSKVRHAHSPENLFFA